MPVLKIKSDKELNSLNTKNLLAYYKAERKRFYSFEGGCTCHCGCGEKVWEVNHGYKIEEKKYEDWQDYLRKIRTILNVREHVELKKKK